ncbi:MAG: translation initiation factor IF-2 [Bacteroidota bacterium]
MTEVKTTRLIKASREFNIGVSTIVEFLGKKGFIIDKDPNGKLSEEMYNLLVKEFAPDKHVKEEAKKINFGSAHETITIDGKRTEVKDKEKEREELFIKNVGLEYDKRHTEIPRKKEIESREPIKEKPVAETSPQPVEVAVIVPEPPVILTPEPVITPVEEKLESPQQEIELPELIVKEEINEPVKEQAVHIEDQQTDQTKPEPVLTPEPEPEPEPEEKIKPTGDLKIFGKIDLDALNKRPSKKPKDLEKPELIEPISLPSEPEENISQPPDEAVEESLNVVDEQPETVVPPVQEVIAPPVEDNFLRRERIVLEGPTILGTMKLPEPRKFEKKKPVASSSDDALKGKKKKRKRIKKQGETGNETTPTESVQPPVKLKLKDKKGFPKETVKSELTQEDIEKQIKETLARLSPSGKSKSSKHRRLKRDAMSQQIQQEQYALEEGKKVIRVTEFVTANDLATMMNVPVTKIISTCMSLGLFVSINQRLDAETLTLVADEFGYKVEFVSVEVQEAISLKEEIDNPEDITDRPPIVTVMGHVDHGKTKLLDFIRSANVVAGEAGGITQHIGAYEMKLEGGKTITFLDTPGHEAFTAMRARGAKVTDVAIIVIAADDNVMPQTREAINHALAAGVPIVFAINKIDKGNANPEKVKEELSKMNILVEDWGGNYQSQEISAKTGLNVNILLEKVLLEAEMLNLKANPSRLAVGTVIESSLDKGRGFVAKLLVHNGTLRVGDIVLAGSTYGKVKAMYNERNQPVREAGPSSPTLMLGLNGAPQAGDVFNVMSDEKEVKAIANKRMQLQREQGIRTQKHITLDEIGRRIAIGDFKELNIIVKGDVDGSVEALSDSLLKLSTQQVVLNVIHKSVGQITESDVLLASASNAVIVGFQVRPSLSARKLAEQEQIDIRLYSIIYTAIEEIKAAIEGMLSPDIEEKIICNIEVREVYKITKVGTVAGCYVLDGKITRNTRIRVIRDGIVVYTGNLGSLKRFKDDVREVSTGYECGLNIDNFNDMKVGDIVEGYEEFEVKRKL